MRCVDVIRPQALLVTFRAPVVIWAQVLAKKKKYPEELPLEKCSLRTPKYGFLRISLSINSLVPKWQYGIHPKGYQCRALHGSIVVIDDGVTVAESAKVTRKCLTLRRSVRISNRLCYSILLSMCVPHHSVDTILQFQETSNTVSFWSSLFVSVCCWSLALLLARHVWSRQGTSIEIALLEAGHSWNCWQSQVFSKRLDAQRDLPKVQATPERVGSSWPIVWLHCLPYVPQKLPKRINLHVLIILFTLSFSTGLHVDMFSLRISTLPHPHRSIHAHSPPSTLDCDTLVLSHAEAKLSCFGRPWWHVDGGFMSHLERIGLLRTQIVVRKNMTRKM